MQMVAVFKTYRLIPHTMVYNDIEWYILVEFHSGVMESLFRSNRSVEIHRSVETNRIVLSVEFHSGAMESSMSPEATFVYKRFIRKREPILHEKKF